MVLAAEIKTLPDGLDPGGAAPKAGGGQGSATPADRKPDPAPYEVTDPVGGGGSPKDFHHDGGFPGGNSPAT